MLTVIMGGYFNAIIMFPNISMTYPILFHSIVGLYSHSYGICIKAFMAVNGKEFCQISNKWCIVVHVIYVNIIIVTIVSQYILDWHSLYTIEYKLLNIHPKCLPIVLKLSAINLL